MGEGAILLAIGTLSGRPVSYAGQVRRLHGAVGRTGQSAVFGT